MSLTCIFNQKYKSNVKIFGVKMQLNSQLITYVMTLALAAFLPGPGMTGLMFKTLLFGYKRGLVMLLGLITGDVIFLTLSIFFMKSIIQLNANAAFYLILLSCLYLGYLAYKFWNFDQNLLEFTCENKASNFLGSYKDGLFITLSNPKTMSFYLALLPTIFGNQDLPQLHIVLVLLTIVILMLVSGSYICFSVKLRSLLSNSKLQKIFLRILSIFMIFLIITMLLRELNMHEFL